MSNEEKYPAISADYKDYSPETPQTMRAFIYDLLVLNDPISLRAAKIIDILLHQNKEMDDFCLALLVILKDLRQSINEKRGKNE